MQVETTVACPEHQLRPPDAPARHRPAIQQVVPALVGEGTTLILNGDVPLIETSTAKALVDACAGAALVLLTVDLFDPPATAASFARPGTAACSPSSSTKDATPEQRLIHEGYSGMMAAPTGALKRWVSALTNNNARGEYYLTDIVAMAVAEGLPVLGIKATPRPRCWASTTPCSSLSWSAPSRPSRPTR